MMTDPAIQQELTFVDKDYPQYLEQFLQHMNNGEVIGIDWVNDEATCGCFYGWMAGLDEEKAFDLELYYSELIGKPYNITPVEALISHITPGDTPGTSDSLTQLEDEITFFLNQKSVQEHLLASLQREEELAQ